MESGIAGGLCSPPGFVMSVRSFMSSSCGLLLLFESFILFRSHYLVVQTCYLFFYFN